MSSDWRDRVAERRQKQLDAIPKEWMLPKDLLPADPLQGKVMHVPYECGILSQRELDITDTEVDEILEKIRIGEWSSVEVTRSFYKRAVIAHQCTNCLTEIFVDRALERAAEVDAYLKNTGKPMGPLHGLPISLKDQFNMKGLETIMGYVAWIGNVSETDAVLVEILYGLGAVPFVRTAVPQTLMWGETHNNVFGRTTNPYNRYLTPGGSSGGEGALLAMKGSPLGVGTDIGGSLRIPSAFCGLYTLRPSYSRLPYTGASNALEGQESISSVLGPMSTSLESVVTFTRAVIGAQPWKKDPLAARKEWDEAAYKLKDHGEGKGKLCFGIMWDNGVIVPHPPLRRAMEWTKAALEAAGHEVIDWECHRHLEIYKNAETIFVADGGEDYTRECEKSGEPLIQSMLPGPHENPHPAPLLDDSYLDGEGEEKRWKGQGPLVKHLTGPPYKRSCWELWQLHKEKRDLRKSHLDHWEATVSRTSTGRAIDAIISPAVAYAAVPHGLNTDSFYTTLCNAMDYATSVFPVTYVDPELDQSHPPHEFHNHEDEAIYEMYTHELFAGIPVGLQLIGRTQEEEGVLGMTEVVDKALKEWKKERKLR